MSRHADPAKLNWEVVREISARSQAGVSQLELAKTLQVSQPLCSQIVRGDIWDPDSKLTTDDEMRDRIIGALDTGCRRGEMMKVQNRHVDWRHRWVRILKEHSKSEVARVIPFEPASRLEQLSRRRRSSARTLSCSETPRLAATCGHSGPHGKRCSCWPTTSRRRERPAASAHRTERSSRRSTCTGTPPTRSAFALGGRRRAGS